MLTWSCGMIFAQTLKKIIDDLRQFEGAKAYMYLDTVSVVTIGVGTALFAVEDVDSVNFVDLKTHLPVGLADKRTAWQTVQNVSGPRGRACTYSPIHFEKFTTIIIGRPEQDRLLNDKLEEFYQDLIRIYPGFDSLPENGKLALFDMIYNLGPSHLEYVFVQFTNAVRSRNWATAAMQSYRPQVGAIRNATIKAYLQSCVTPRTTKRADHPRKRLQKIPETRPALSAYLPLPPPPEPFPRPPYHQAIPLPLRFVHNRLIRPGDQGTDVRLVQNAANRMLVGRRPPLKLDGKFGLMTSGAVRAVQSSGGLVPDGLVGAETRTALGLVLI